MTILDDLLRTLNMDVPVRSILIGVHWTVVCSRHCGMASTLVTAHTHGHVQVRDAGNLLNKSTKELANLACSDELLEASIGLATINSLLEVDESLAVEINASEVLAERGRGRNVAIIGSFPFIPQLRPLVGRLWVIEQRPGMDEHPAESAAELLPQADVVAITASSIINHTFDNLLELCPPQATVMVLGPSTPLSPLLFERGVSIMSGTRILDEAAVLRTVAQGASFQQVKGVRLLTFAREGTNV